MEWSQKKRQNKKRKAFVLLLILIAAAGIIAAIKNGEVHLQISPPLESSVSSEIEQVPEDKISQYAREHGLSITEYPDILRELLAKNPETEKFVLEYPIKKDNRFTGSLDECANAASVPLLMQWDQRWGYTIYGDDVMGITGCGPTSLSMVAVYLLGDTRMSPGWMAEYSTQNGYCVPGNGTSWTLMSEGAEGLGLKSTELPLVKSLVFQQLEEGHPIICIMGPGDFTTTGHYIVLTGCEDGMLKVNDCNSRERSEKLWDFDLIQGQIRNLWAFEKA